MVLEFNAQEALAHYGNEWYSFLSRISRYKDNITDTTALEVLQTPIKTVKEFYDLRDTIIPDDLLIHNAVIDLDELVRLCNELLNESAPDLEKLAELAERARKIIRDHSPKKPYPFQ